MSRHGGGDDESGAPKETNVAGVTRRKGKTSRRGSSKARPWTPSRALYGDLKIPITEIGKKKS